MSPQAKIDQDLVTAMKEGVATRTTVLRLLKSAFKNEQIKVGHELGDDEIMKVLQREAKQRRDSIQQYTDGNRIDLADAEQFELDTISEYLPQQMDEAELPAIIDSVIADTGASGLPQTGVVIGAVMGKVAGRADGATVSRLVRTKLQ